MQGSICIPPTYIMINIKQGRQSALKITSAKRDMVGEFQGIPGQIWALNTYGAGQKINQCHGTDGTGQFGALDDK